MEGVDIITALKPGRPYKSVMHLIFPTKSKLTRCFGRLGQRVHNITRLSTGPCIASLTARQVFPLSIRPADERRHLASPPRYHQKTLRLHSI